MFQYIPQAPFQQVPQQPTFQEVEGMGSIDLLRLNPNSKAVYFDRHLDRFYTVSTDATGSKSIVAYDFKKAEPDRKKEYVTREEFDLWKEQHEQPISRPREIELQQIRKPVYQSDPGEGYDRRDAQMRSNI